MEYISHIFSNDKRTTSATDQCNGKALYSCGGCRAEFQAIGSLHEHMISHDTGGSYHYDHTIFTAFPKFEHICTASQTDFIGKDYMFTLCEFRSNSNKAFKDGSEKEQQSDNKNRKTTQDFVTQFDSGSCSQTNGEKHEGNVNLDKTETAFEYLDMCSKDISRKGVLAETKYEITENSVDLNITMYDCPIPNCDLAAGSLESSHANIQEDSASGHKLTTDNQGKGIDLCNNRVKFSKIHPVGKNIDLPSWTRNRSLKGMAEFDNNLKSDCQGDEKLNLKCQLCGKLLSSEAYLKRHLKIVHQYEEISKNSLHSFKEEHIDHETNSSCSYCEKQFLTTDAKLKHINLEHHEIASDLKKFKEENCPKNKQISCKLCGKMFASPASLSLHLSSVHLKKKFKCDICNLELSQKTTLKTHKIERHHENMRGFDCTICKRTFAFKFRLKSHMEQVHTPPSETSQTTYICESCGHIAKNRSSLRYHSRKHDVQRKQYQCEICPYKTFYKSSLTEHTASHQNNRRFVCDVCGDKFFTNKQLKVHMRRHTGEMPYQCNVCSRKFRTDIALSRHRDIHLNKMRYKCEYCDKEFVQKTNCTAHMRQHTGEKPFKCDWCGKDFTHNKSRKDHMRKCSESQKTSM